jgi:hypothetical protein
MRQFFVAMAVLAVLLAAGCQKKGFDEDCSQFMDNSVRSACMYNQSMLLRNPANCKDIPNMTIRVRCIDELAIKYSQDYYCTYHARLPDKEACEQKVADAMRAAKASAGTT